MGNELIKVLDRCPDKNCNSQLLKSPESGNLVCQNSYPYCKFMYFNAKENKQYWVTEVEKLVEKAIETPIENKLVINTH